MMYSTKKFTYLIFSSTLFLLLIPFTKAKDEYSNHESLRRKIKNENNENKPPEGNNGSNGNNNNNGYGSSGTKKRVIVQYAKDTKGDVTQKLDAYGPNYHYQMDDIGLIVVDLPIPAIEALQKNKNKDILVIEEDPIVTPIETFIDVKTVNKEGHGRNLEQTEPYGIGMVKADLVDQTGAGVTVCVIDSGIDLDHVDLQFIGGITGESPGVDWTLDTCEHGTHVVGTIAAQDNDIGVVGVAPGVNIHIFKVFDGVDCSYTYGSDVLDAGRACVSAGAKVISMSLGTSTYSSALETGWESILLDDNVLPIAAAGNDGNTAYSYPASYDAVVSVAAVDSYENAAYFSQRNDQVDVAAPGVSVYSTINNDSYDYYSGTSMATPHVAGVAALIWEASPAFTATEVRQLLMSTAKDLGNPGIDNTYGHGLVNAFAAMSPNCSDDSDCNDFDDCTIDACVDSRCTWSNIDDPTCGITELTSATSITISEENAGIMHLYWLSMSVGDIVTCSISGYNGDADLYTQINTPPTTSTYECRPFSFGSNEECVFGPAGAGENYLFVGIRGYSSYQDIVLQCIVETCVSDGTCTPDLGLDCGSGASGTDNCGYSCTIDLDECPADQICSDNVCTCIDPTPTCGYTPLSLATPVTISEPTAGEMHFFWLQLSLGSTVTCTITGDDGDADLYTRVNEAPTRLDYDCRPYYSGSNEECVTGPTNTGEEYLFVGIRAYSPFQDVVLRCDSNCVPDGVCTPNAGLNCGNEASGIDNCFNPCLVDLGTCSDGQTCQNNICTSENTKNLEFMVIENVGSDWVRVPLTAGYTSPVPVCTVQYPTDTGIKPVVVRMMNLRRRFFDIKLQNPSKDSDLPNLNVHCIVSEQGTFNLPNGKRVVARKMWSRRTAYKEKWIRPRAPTSLAEFTTPVVVGQIISYNDERWSSFFTTSTSRLSPPSDVNGFRVGKHVGEDTDKERVDELIGYIVIDAHHDTVDGIELEAGITEDTIWGYGNGGSPFDHPFASAFGDTPQSLVMTQNGMDGGDGGWAVSYPATSTQLRTAIDEDQISDAERSHTSEQVAYIAFGPNNGFLPLIPVA